MLKRNYLQTYHPVEKKLLCTTYLKDHHHFNFPGLNVASKKLIGEEITPDVACENYKPPLLNISRPIPCLPTEYVAKQSSYDCKIDQVMELVREKYFWKQKKKPLQNALNRVYSNPELVRAFDENEPVQKLPYGVLRMADHHANNPDKYFNGRYHWYFGNAIRKFTIDGHDFLLYPSGENLNELCMTLFNKPNRSEVVPSLIPQISVSMPTSGFIYDIVTNDRIKAIAVRQRDACSFFNYYKDCDGNISFEDFATIKSSEYPFIAMDISDTEFVTVDGNRSVQFWESCNLGRCNTYNLPEINPKLSDRFIQIKYDRDHSTKCFVVVDRQNVYFYDRRENCAKPSSQLSSSKQTESCEEISLLLPSVNRETWYLGMTHSCFLLDPRMGFAKKWTHMMTQAPSVGHTLRINKESNAAKEVLILSTQTTNESIAIYRNKEKPEETRSPVRVYNRLDTLHEGHLNGILTDIHLQNKFNFSTIGITSYKRKKRMGILSLISTGDIFHQHLERTKGMIGFDENSTSLTEDELQYLENWERGFHSLHAKKKRSLTVSREVDFADLVNSIDETVKVPAWRSYSYPRKAHWKIPIKSLHKYKDMLAPYLLDNFGVEDFQDSSSEGEQNYSHSDSDADEDENTDDIIVTRSNPADECISSSDSTVALDVISSRGCNSETLIKPPKKRRKRR